MRIFMQRYFIPALGFCKQVSAAVKGDESIGYDFNSISSIGKTLSNDTRIPESLAAGNTGHPEDNGGPVGSHFRMLHIPL